MTENEKSGFVLINKTDTIKSDLEKKKTENNETDHSINQKGRYKFYMTKYIFFPKRLLKK